MEEQGFDRTKNIIPGYTGYIPKDLAIDDDQNYNHKGKVPGYIGFIPGLKSENIFGKTYGKITTTIEADITGSR